MKWQFARSLRVSDDAVEGRLILTPLLAHSTPQEGELGRPDIRNSLSGFIALVGTDIDLPTVGIRQCRRFESWIIRLEQLNIHALGSFILVKSVSLHSYEPLNLLVTYVSDPEDVSILDVLVNLSAII